MVALLNAGPAKAQQAAGDLVAFGSRDRTGTQLAGWLWKPRGNAASYPAVVMLHGCGGALNNAGRVNSRTTDWADRLAAAGYVVLAVDSFGPRGIKSTCTKSAPRLAPSARDDDALGALAWLRGLPIVQPDRVAVLGWSAGAQVVLSLANDREGKATGVSGGNFRAAVAFYPGCRGFNENTRWRTRIPLQIEMGAADDWTPPAPCQELVQRRQAAGDPIAITLYPGAYHGFDAPNTKVQLREGLARTADGTGRAHMGTDPMARQAAITEVLTFLQHRLKD